MNRISNHIFRIAIVAVMSLFMLGLFPAHYGDANAGNEGEGQKGKDEIKGTMMKAYAARDEVYGIYVPTRPLDPNGKRVGRIEGQRLAKWDRTITEDERFKLEFPKHVDDLNNGIADPINEFAPKIDPDGHYFVMWGNMAAGALTISRWVLLNEPGIRASQKVRISRTRSDQIVLHVVKPDNIRSSAGTFAVFGNSFIDQAAQAMRRIGTTPATEIEADALAVFAAERGSTTGTAFVEKWRLTPASAETPLAGKRLSFAQKFEFRTSKYLDSRPQPPPFKFESKMFSSTGGTIEIQVKKIAHAIPYQSPTPYRISLVQVKDQAKKTVASYEASGQFHFRYEISPQDARDIMWQVTIEPARNEAQQCEGEFGCEVPYDYAPAPYIIAYVDYMDILDNRGQVGEGDGEFTFVFASSTGSGDERRDFAVRFPAEHHLDVPGPVTYDQKELQVPFFARRESQMGPVLGIALTGREYDDPTAADIVEHVHKMGGTFWDAYTQNRDGEFRKQAVEDAKAWLKILGWTGSETIGPHLRRYHSDEDYGIGFQEPLEFANAGVGPRGEKVHYTIKRVNAWQLTGLKVTLNSITVPRQHPHNGGNLIWDNYKVFAIARAADGFYGGEIEAAKRIPKKQDKYLVDSDAGHDRPILVNKVIYERWAQREVPFVYVEFVLYDDDNDGFDQLVMEHKAGKSAIYSRLFLLDELLIEGHAAGARRIQEARGGITVDYTIEWTR